MRSHDLLCKQGVTGSSPVGSTIGSKLQPCPVIGGQGCFVVVQVDVGVELAGALSELGVETAGRLEDGLVDAGELLLVLLFISNAFKFLISLVLLVKVRIREATQQCRHRVRGDALDRVVQRESATQSTV